MFILPLFYEKCTETNCIFSIKESDILHEKNQICEKAKFTELSLLNKKCESVAHKIIIDTMNCDCK